MSVDQTTTRSSKAVPAWISAALTIVLIVSFGARIYRLGEIPAGLFCDEAANGYNAYSLLHTGRDEHGKVMPLFIWSFYAFKYPLDIYASIPWVGLFGLTEFATRFQAAVYGVGGIFLAFLIGRQLFRPLCGLAAAIFLAVMPWHFHFSRIAFAMTSFTFWFGLAFYFLVRALGPEGRRRDYILAGVGFSTCFYAYAVSQIFVPAFVLLALPFCLPAIWRRPKWAVLGAIAALVTALPFVIFYVKHLDRASVYVRQTSVLAQAIPVAEKVKVVRENYPVYFKSSFLTEHGDPIVRHGVRHFGVLHKAMILWVIAGAALALVWPDLRTKLVLVWIALYPLGAALTRETPSATRSAIGMMAFALLAGIAFDRVVAALQRIPVRGAGITASFALAIGATVPLARQTQAYLHEYFVNYPNYASVGIEGFQYGYKELFRLMEERRSEVDDLFYSSTSVNSPYILNLFYVRRPPKALNEWGDAETDYRAVRPVDVDRWYNPNRKILMAALDLDMLMFESWDERIDITGPSGRIAFILLRNPVPKKFVTDWEVIGPFENDNNRNQATDLLDPVTMEAKVPAMDGEARWQRYLGSKTLVELNQYFGPRAVGSPPNNAEFAIAYLRTYIRSPDDREVILEIFGSHDPMYMWINGQMVSGTPVMLRETSLNRVALPLRKGRNVLLLKFVESVGDWWFQPRFVGKDGKPEDSIVVSADPAELST